MLSPTLGQTGDGVRSEPALSSLLEDRARLRFYSVSSVNYQQFAVINCDITLRLGCDAAASVEVTISYSDDQLSLARCAAFVAIQS